MHPYLDYENLLNSDQLALDKIMLYAKNKQSELYNSGDSENQGTMLDIFAFIHLAYSDLQNELETNLAFDGYINHVSHAKSLDKSVISDVVNLINKLEGISNEQ